MRLLCLMILFTFPTSWIFVHCELRITKNFDDDWIKFLTDHWSNTTSNYLHFNNTMRITSWINYFSRYGTNTPSSYGCRLCRPIFYKFSSNQGELKIVKHELRKEHERVMKHLRGKLSTDDLSKEEIIHYTNTLER